MGETGLTNAATGLTSAPFPDHGAKRIIRTMRSAKYRGTASLAYQLQDSPLTLAEGLEEYYAANVGRVTRPRDLPAESANLFVSHDICHVIFGLNTAPDDEAMADVRTMLSCDVGVRRYAAYLASNTQAQALFKEFGYLRSLWVAIAAAPRLCRALGEAWRMKRRWPWSPPEAFRARTLADLRSEFGIRVI